MHTHSRSLSSLTHTHTIIMHFHTRTHTRSLSLTRTHARTHTTHTCTHTHARTHTHIHRPRSDTCKTCDTFKVQTDGETDDSKRALLMGEWDLNKAKAQHAYQQLCEDTALSKSSADVELLMFDLEQSLATVLTTNVVFSQTAALDLQFGNPQWENGQGLYAHVPRGYCIKRITGSRVLSPEACQTA